MAPIRQNPTTKAMAEATADVERSIEIARRRHESETLVWALTLAAELPTKLNIPQLLSVGAVNALMASRASRPVIVADSSKIGRRAFARWAARS